VCKTELTLSYDPLFEGEEITKTKFICGRPWSVHIPEYMDYFGQPALTTVNLGDAKEFLTYSPVIRNITTGDFDTSNLSSGSFTIEVKNTDLMMKSKSEKIKFEILCFKGMNETQKDAQKWVPSKLAQLNPPRPLISQIN